MSNILTIILTAMITGIVIYVVQRILKENFEEKRLTISECATICESDTIDLPENN